MGIAPQRFSWQPGKSQFFFEPFFVKNGGRGLGVLGGAKVADTALPSGPYYHFITF
jgi:hypothetical protein